MDKDISNIYLEIDFNKILNLHPISIYSQITNSQTAESSTKLKVIFHIFRISTRYQTKIDAHSQRKKTQKRYRRTMILHSFFYSIISLPSICLNELNILF